MTQSEFRKVNTDEMVLKLVDSLPEMRSLSLEGPDLTNAALELLAANCFELRELSLAGTKVTDQGLQYIGKLPSLHWLVIDCENATDQGLRRVITLPALKGLHLVDTKVSEAGFASLKSLNELVYLEVVTSNDIGTEGLRSITEKVGLEYLRLSVSKTGEDKFSQLVLSSSLKSFTFEMPLIGESAMKQLREKYPTCQIERYRYQRSEYQSEYEEAMKLAIERSPVPTKQLPQYEKYTHNGLKRPKPQMEESWQNIPVPVVDPKLTPSGQKPTGWLSPEEVAMLVERGLLDPNFYKFNRVLIPNKNQK